MSARAKPGPRASALVPVSEARVGSLKRLNDRVEAARCGSDLLYRIITDPSGTDLRALVAKIRAHILSMAEQYQAEQRRLALLNEQLRRVTSSFTHKPLGDDDLQCIAHLFDKLCGLECNANDDKARLAQLAVVFSILTIDIDVRRELLPPRQQLARFGADGKPLVVRAAAIDDDRKAANLIDESALGMFLQHNALPLMSAYRDGMMTALEYVDRCVEAFIGYLPTLPVRTARLFFGD